MENGYQKNIDVIQDFETHNSISNFRFKDVDLWPLIRFRLFMQLFRNKDEVSHKRGRLPIIKIFIHSLLNSAFSKKSKIKENKYMFLGSENGRRAHKNGKLYHIFFDALIEKYKINDYAVLELNNSVRNSEKFSQNVLSIDHLMLKNLLLAHIFYRLTPSISANLDSILSQWEFNNSPFTKKQIKKLLHLAYLEYRINKITLKHLINRIKPKILFFTCSYCYWNNIALQYCNKVGIKTIELQHGVINKNHIGYIYRQKRSGYGVPAHFLVFGQKEFKILKEKMSSEIIPDGNPYFQLLRQSQDFDNFNLFSFWPQCNNKKIILITSQGLTGNYLINFTEEISKLLNSKYIIVYRLHQNERANYNANKFSKLLSLPNVIVQTDDRISLPQILKNAYVHASVFSTVLEEAVAFSIPNLVIKFQGWENANHLIEKKLAVLVSTPREFVDSLENLPKTNGDDADFFYTKESYRLKTIL